MKYFIFIFIAFSFNSFANNTDELLKKYENLTVIEAHGSLVDDSNVDSFDLKQKTKDYRNLPPIPVRTIKKEKEMSFDLTRPKKKIKYDSSTVVYKRQ